MATWSVIVANSPLNGGGIVAPLRLVGGLSATFNLLDSSSCSFTLPARHYQTPLVVPLVSDVLLYRDDTLVQRFRITSRQVSSVDGKATATFTGSSYREVLNARIFRENAAMRTSEAGGNSELSSLVSVDQLDWPSGLSGSQEQTSIAYAIITQTQAKAHGSLGITRTGALVPTDNVNVSAWVNDVSTNVPAQHFFEVGESVGQAIQAKLAGVDNGFEWEIEPDPNNPAALLFNSWNSYDVGRGYPGRNYHAGAPSTLVLTDASMQSWDLAQQAANFWNVIRTEGGTQTTTSGSSLTLAAPVAWRPITGDPAGSALEGRWEKNDPESQIATTADIKSYATQQALLGGEIDEWSCTLHPGIWAGPGHLWVGDRARLLLTVDTVYDDGSAGDQLLDVDATLRVLGINVTVATNGSEQVSLTLNRPATQFLDGPIPDRLAARLAALERQS